MDVVVVESPTKAKTITKYVGGRYAVLASNGHVRDLPEKDGSVLPDDGFAMRWQVMARSQKNLSSIVSAVRNAKNLYLATDPDREGEAISWHVCAALAEKAVLKDVDVKRVVFHEVTETAVNEALRNPRDLDQGLIDAYLARRALDYLVGFTLSPVLWRKLPGARSAGRVQSVALRLICEREAEIEVFRPREYWSIEAELMTARKAAVTARLTHLNGAKLGRYDIPDEQTAAAAVSEIERHAYSVSAIEKKQVRRNPQPPFTTSTLQQEASRKLGVGASPDHAQRAAALRGDRSRRRDRGADHLYAHGQHQPRQRGAPGDAPADRDRVRAGLRSPPAPTGSGRAPRTRRRPMRQSARPTWHAGRPRSATRWKTTNGGSTS